MASRPDNQGPSKRLLAWRRFWFEVALIILLLVVIGLLAVDRPHGIVQGAAITACAGVILQILWRRP